jgi:hypothetical protein
MKRLLLSMLFAFALVAISIAVSQTYSWRAAAEESAACCSEVGDCKTGETCDSAAQGQTPCCDPNNSQCKGAKYCNKKPEGD